MAPASPVLVLVTLGLTLVMIHQTVDAEVSPNTFVSRQNSIIRDKVKLTVYMESLCSDTRTFFRRQLTPTYRLLGDIVDVEFVPFGKAIATPSLRGGRIAIAFQCQHGPRECAGNLVMSCAQSVLDTTEQHDLFACMLAARDPSAAAQACCLDLGLEWQPIDSCTRTEIGSVMLYMNGRKTADLRPRLYYVPTVTVNGRYSRRSLQRSTNNLLKQVCQAYGGYHPNCP